MDLFEDEMMELYSSYNYHFVFFAVKAMFFEVESVDEIFQDERPVYDTTPGNEIVFSATGGIQAGNPKTKTEYGSPFDSDDNGV